ncbi:phosphoribosylamine--glycine ligase [Rhodohalobacter halophilus]|uniref:phosphoribosylamine--glycine ligase n=1 Tax=Rhodohalobacter halophilus TaxID=1812810 RepID=UPI00083F754E|nr:phosphoribosylamine--glycine ligase [Rhodohalobacter halophilus]
MDTNYNVLLIGSGGREHAIAWKLKKSPNLGTLYIAPGNPGTAQCGLNVKLDTGDFPKVVEFCKDHSIDLVVVGPEVPLVNGIVDFLEKEGIAVFGPQKKAALLEGSKQFAKEFMVKYDVPTADYAVFSADEFDDALTFVQSKDSYPIVLKADGLAAGKGVFICDSEEEVKKRLNTLKHDSKLQDAASKLVIEEFMEGEEASVFVISDGHSSHILHNAQDHKRIGDGDTGLNTGGMGAYSPAPVLTDDMLERVKVEIIERTITGMQLEESAYQGILYVGLMITENGPKVVEYNCRFGDPECQVIMPTLENDLLNLMISTTEQRLDELSIQLDGDYRCCVVLASEGYPGAYEKGKTITGLNEVDDESIVFHAGTKQDGDDVITNGGRVLNIVGRGSTLKQAIDHAYKNVKKIHFDGCYYRTDIGHKGLDRVS